MNYKILFEQYLQEQLNIQDSMQYSVYYTLLNGGNRFRPLLTLIWCNISGGRAEDALPLATAIECIHTMSLIQDDLPCMDNAIERRGQTCLHLHTNEANAILTSDYLLQLSFTFILSSKLSNYQKLLALEVLNKAILSTIDGQNKELHNSITTIDDYLDIHANKTGSLLAAAAELGVIAAQKYEMQSLAHTYGEALGIGYQIFDDIKDNDGLLNIISIEKMKQLLDYYKNISYNISKEYETLQILTERIFT